MNESPTNESLIWILTHILLDNVAFELAQCGKYGPVLEAEAKRIKDLPAPSCIFRKYQHVRYSSTIVPIAMILFVLLGLTTYCQISTKFWVTKILRVQFTDNTNLEMFSGCYVINQDLARNQRKVKRKFYHSHEANPESAKFGYCDDDHKWLLYTGDSRDVCNLAEENKLAYSEKTYSFGTIPLQQNASSVWYFLFHDHAHFSLYCYASSLDIESSFDGSWASRTGAPLGLYFFSEEEDLNDTSCSAFLGDGICNYDFNTMSYSFDYGDCCATTCSEPECGFGTMKKAFDTDIQDGDGYPECEDSDMVPITVHLNDVFNRNELDKNSANEEPRHALMTLDCDDSNVLLVSINKAMMNNTETVMVADGANCSMMVKNVSGAFSDVWFVNYTIYHGNKSSIETNPIVMKTGSSFEKEVTTFQRIPNCFFTKLSDYINKTTIYTGADPSNQAIDWLLEGSSVYSKCERRNFNERYALAVINFAAPIYEDGVMDGNGLWISEGRQCAWKNVICVSGNVAALDVGFSSGISLKGTMATEIGLLKHLTELDMCKYKIPPSLEEGIIDCVANFNSKSLSHITIGFLATNYIRGTISTEIGECQNLQSINIGKEGGG